MLACVGWNNASIFIRSSSTSVSGLGILYFPLTLPYSKKNTFNHVDVPTYTVPNFIVICTLVHSKTIEINGPPEFTVMDSQTSIHRISLPSLNACMCWLE